MNSGPALWNVKDTTIYQGPRGSGKSRRLFDHIATRAGNLDRPSCVVVPYPERYRIGDELEQRGCWVLGRGPSGQGSVGPQVWIHDLGNSYIPVGAPNSHFYYAEDVHLWPEGIYDKLFATFKFEAITVNVEPPFLSPHVEEFYLGRMLRTLAEVQ